MTCKQGCQSWRESLLQGGLLLQSKVIARKLASCPPFLFFPKIRFWTAKEWNTYKSTQRRNNETIRKLAFVTTSDGGPVTNEYLEQMSETARRLFNELYNRGLALPTWKAKSQTASDFFINTIVLDFPELRWCEGGRWKAEAFAVTRYPDCSRKFFNTGSFFSLSVVKVLLRSSFL